MLTVKDINEVSFGKAGFSGYKPEDVDAFIDTVAESFKELHAEREGYSGKVAELQARNASLQEKLAILAEKIESYRKEEDGIKDAIITAQVTARSTVKDAEKKAEIILANADHQAQMTLSAAEKESRRMTEEAREDAAQTARMYAEQIGAKKKELEEVKKQVTAFRNSLLEMYKKHLECIDHIPSFHNKEPEETQAIETAPQEAKQTEEIAVTTEIAAEPMKEVSISVSPVQQNAPVIQPQPELLQEPVTIRQPQAPTEQVQTALPRQPENREIAQSAPAQNRIKAQPFTAPAPSHQTQTIPTQNNPMTQKVNYAQRQRIAEAGTMPVNTPAVGFPYDVDDDLSGVGINTTTFSSIPESLLREKKAGYSNLEFGEGIDVTRK